MKTKKKIIIYVIIAIIISFLAWMYSAGYVPFIGNMIATDKINSYNREVYNASDEIKIGYDFYNMGDYNGEGYLYNLNSDRIVDFNLYENAGDETPYKQDYQKIIDSLEEGIVFEDYHITCSIDADDYSNKYYKLVVFNLSNENILTEEESGEKPAEIVMQFINSMETQYNFTSVNVLYTDNNGEKQISLNGDIPISEEILIENTK